ncbi:MAG: ribbon-helix-helix domain-containing protein [Firmicutes bacterium]|nr:ribbon-helix-helix domain-containing protein [Bacillota bacterium]
MTNYFSPQKPDKEVISIRLPADLLQAVDTCAARADISRNEFINQCILFAMAHLKEEGE